MLRKQTGRFIENDMHKISFGIILGSFGTGPVSGPTLCNWAEEVERHTRRSASAHFTGH
jgi:hypothetical protein